MPKQDNPPSPSIPDFEVFDRVFEQVMVEGTITGTPGLLETFGADLERILATDPKHVWTVVESDSDESSYLIAGPHIVNRVGYVISKRPWATGEEIFFWVNAADYSQ